MTASNLPIQWRAIVRAVAIAYGTTFVSGLVLALAGISPEAHPVGYPLLALFTGAVGVALALRAADTSRLSYLLAIGVGVWLLSSTSVLFGAQSFLQWINSSVFIGITLILGRLLVGTSLDTVPASAVPYSAFIHRAPGTHRNS
ncbi:MAG: hypothetical protein E8D46_01240 [Nitrospira sp.]|nr:hypothetical protein [Nitrospira sp.]TKB75473.1 MAG: hypothetical protein E8D46_01240 [Nitrospira sp.]